MTAKELWSAFGGEGEYEAWSFGSDADGLAALVLAGKKTATASAYPLYELEGEPLPQAGDIKAPRLIRFNYSSSVFAA